MTSYWIFGLTRGHSHGARHHCDTVRHSTQNVLFAIFSARKFGSFKYNLYICNLKTTINIKIKKLMKKSSPYLIILMALITCAMMFTFSACGGGDDDPSTSEKPNPSGGGGTDTPQGTLQLMQTCHTCSGSKQCVQCNGTGKGCPTCKSKGIYCKECGTSGECAYCYGAGVCQRCNGKKGEECIKCGWRHGKCQQCGGSGKSLGIKCQACGGSGVCDKCHGNWWTDCYSCGGTGNCNYCRGNKVCPSCHGNPPACTTCGGDGHCSACTNSDGKCKNCSGTGEQSLSSLSFTEKGGDETVFIHSSSAWNVSTDVDWIRPSRSSGNGDYTITVTIDKNPTASPRNGVITFTYGNLKTTINVAQSGETPALAVNSSYVTLGASGSAETINITSNTSWTVRSSDSWVTCSPSSGSGNATISVNASAYTTGVRYALLTITDASGQLSSEIRVAQAANPSDLTALKNWLEKPMGILNVNMKTASFQTIKNAVANVYTIDEGKYESGTVYFFLWGYKNDACRDMTYQGIPFYYMYANQSQYTKKIEYFFEIDASKASYDYTSYLNNILQDFKYNMNITLEKKDNGSYLAYYSGYDSDGINYYCVYVSEYKSSENNRKYDFEIIVYYK